MSLITSRSGIITKKTQIVTCGICGYKFKLGDKWQRYYDDDDLSSVIVCKACDDDKDLAAKFANRNRQWL